MAITIIKRHAERMAVVGMGTSTAVAITNKKTEERKAPSVFLFALYQRQGKERLENKNLSGEGRGNYAERVVSRLLQKTGDNSHTA